MSLSKTGIGNLNDSTSKRPLPRYIGLSCIYCTEPDINREFNTESTYNGIHYLFYLTVTLLFLIVFFVIVYLYISEKRRLENVHFGSRTSIVNRKSSYIAAHEDEIKMDAQNNDTLIIGHVTRSNSELTHQFEGLKHNMRSQPISKNDLYVILKTVISRIIQGYLTSAQVSTRDYFVDKPNLEDAIAVTICA